MNTKATWSLAALAVLLIVGAGLLSLGENTTPIGVTQREAIDAVIAEHPDLAKYETTSLPPSEVLAKVAFNGWDVAFIQRGSGLPGILNAGCYHVDDNKVVSLNGEFKYKNDQIVQAIEFDTCLPVLYPPITVTPEPTTLNNKGI